MAGAERGAGSASTMERDRDRLREPGFQVAISGGAPFASGRPDQITISDAGSGSRSQAPLQPGRPAPESSCASTPGMVMTLTGSVHLWGAACNRQRPRKGYLGRFKRRTLKPDSHVAIAQHLVHNEGMYFTKPFSPDNWPGSGRR